MSLIYSCVARAPPSAGAEDGYAVLAEHTAFSGNFKEVSTQCLGKLPGRNDRFTFAVDGHTFNYLVNDRVVYGVVAQAEVGKALPFGFLEKVKEEFLVSCPSAPGRRGPLLHAACPGAGSAPLRAFVFACVASRAAQPGGTIIFFRIKLRSQHIPALSCVQNTVSF